MTAEELAERLGAKRSGKGWMASCPAHEDRTPSLSIAEGDNGGTLLKCMADCTLDQVLAALKMTLKDLAPPSFTTNGHDETVYRYTHETGALLFEVVRRPGKKFLQRRPDGAGGWTWKRSDRLVLYRLPQVLKAVAAGATVYIVEGEKDADRVVAEGSCATTNPMGAGKWSKVRDHALEVLAGADVIVVQDRDRAGRDHAAEVAASLQGVAANVILLEPVEGKDVSDHLAAGHTLMDLAEVVHEAQQQGAITAVIPPTEGEAIPRGIAPSDLAGLLDEVAAFIKRFMVMTDHQTDAVTLFAAHTHAVDAFDVVAYLFITSAVRRSGKTLLEELLEQLCLRGRSTTNISPAAVYRMVDQIKPTLLFDEVDNIFAKGRAGDPTKTDLIGLINAGYRRGKPAYRMGGANMRTLEAFDPFCPKVLAGIGGCLPDTTEDRCIKIRLERKDRTVAVDRYRIRLHEDVAKDLGERLGAISTLNEILRGTWPDLPDELDDRAQDIWEPLLIIADTAGGTWPARARASALALNDLRADSTEPAGIELLADIRRLFDADGHDRMFSNVMVDKLNALEETPWAGWHRGAGFRTFDLARLLRDFAVRSKDVRIGAEVKKGYLSEHFADAWARYLDATEPGATPATGATGATHLARHVAGVAGVAANPPEGNELF